MDPEAHSAKKSAHSGAKLSQLLINEKRYEEAVAVLVSVIKLEPSHTYWYRLKWAQLQASDYKKVLEGPQAFGLPSLSGTEDPKLSAVLAEASIKLATQARESGDIEQMGTYLARFERVSADPAKVDVARDEWVTALVAKKAYEDAIRKMGEFGVAWMRRPEAVSASSRLLHELLDGARLELLPKVLAQWPVDLRPPGEAQALLWPVFTLRVPQGCGLKRFEPLSSPSASFG